MFSKILRRTHMYLALALMPWMAMYALSTIAMNHRDFFRSPENTPPAFELIAERSYPAAFSPETTPAQIGEQILATLGLEGRYSARRANEQDQVIIQRQDLVHPYRITYLPTEQKLVVERQVFSGHAFLERFHRRRGYETDSLKDDAWAGTVDLVILAMVFWALSGLWMWWEMRATRKWGALAFVSGGALFLLFLFTI